MGDERALTLIGIGGDCCSLTTSTRNKRNITTLPISFISRPKQGSRTKTKQNKNEKHAKNVHVHLLPLRMIIDNISLLMPTLKISIGVIYTEYSKNDT